MPSKKKNKKFSPDADDFEFSEEELKLAEIGRQKNKEEASKNFELETDLEGKIVLYHATSAKNYIKIENDAALKTPKETGERSWRLKIEDKDQEKMGKIYLATRKEAEIIAGKLQATYGGTFYILETHVDKEKLFPDEDSSRKSWDGSLRSIGTCSHKGDINNFKVADKLGFKLSNKERESFFLRNAKAQSQEEKEKINEELKELIAKKEAEEKDQLEKMKKEFSREASAKELSPGERTKESYNKTSSQEYGSPGRMSATYREELPESNIQAMEEQPIPEEIPGEGKESSPGYIPGWEDALTGEEPAEKQTEEKQPGKEEAPDENGEDDSSDLGGDELPNFPSEKEIESQIEEAGARERVGPMDPDFLLILLFAVIVDLIDIILELTSFLVIPKLIGIAIDFVVFLIIGGWMYWRTKKISESKKAALAGITKSLQSQVKSLERLRKIGKIDQKVFDRYMRRYSQKMGKMGTTLARAARSPAGRTIVKASLVFLGEIILIVGLIPFWTISVVLMLREE